MERVSGHCGIVCAITPPPVFVSSRTAYQAKNFIPRIDAGLESNPPDELYETSCDLRRVWHHSDVDQRRAHGLPNLTSQPKARCAKALAVRPLRANCAIIGAGPLGPGLRLRQLAGFACCWKSERATCTTRRSLRRSRQRRADVPLSQPLRRRCGGRFGVDCVPDELESKLEIFWLLDRMAPRGRVATPTTRLSIADLALAPTGSQCVAWLGVKLARADTEILCGPFEDTRNG